MEDWEDEIPPLPAKEQLKSKWDDEDIDDSDIKESWEADYKSMTELFFKKGNDKTLDNFIPKSESDFVEYAELISHRLCPYEKSYHYIALLKAVMRLSLTSLKAADVKDIASSVTTILNGKIAVKEKKSSKKMFDIFHIYKNDNNYYFRINICNLATMIP
ncbi:hypothetical protein ES288_D11G097800v1 [Gossypium darwinii]|uniref:Uncharacterized protein n=1 Tax=Gossypium darwinii TaxID=34276 RepID=A0A5D2AJE1_GOSDA|nr:hypothetical protein ES288_D11G097800v1 [Gossypium darwinii]